VNAGVKQDIKTLKLLFFPYIFSAYWWQKNTKISVCSSNGLSI